MSKRREREGEDEGEKKEGGEVLKTEEGKRKCLTTKHRYYSLYVNFNLLMVRLSKMAEVIYLEKGKSLKFFQNQLKRHCVLEKPRHLGGSVGQASTFSSGHDLRAWDRAPSPC